MRLSGLPFSPDKSILYVAETDETHIADTPRAIHAYAVGVEGRTLAVIGAVAVCDNGFFDGFRIGIHGNLWPSTADSAPTYSPDGTLPGRVRVPELVSTLCPGGGNCLYIAAQTALCATSLNPHAANWAGAREKRIS